MAPAAPARSSSSSPWPPRPPNTDTSSAAVSCAMATDVGGASALTAMTKRQACTTVMRDSVLMLTPLASGIVLQHHLGAGGLVDGVQVRGSPRRGCAELAWTITAARRSPATACAARISSTAVPRVQRGHAHHERKAGFLDGGFQDQAAFRGGQRGGLAEDAQDRQAGGADGLVALHEPGQAVQCPRPGVLPWNGVATTPHTPGVSDSRIGFSFELVVLRVACIPVSVPATRAGAFPGRRARPRPSPRCPAPP